MSWPAVNVPGSVTAPARAAREVDDQTDAKVLPLRPHLRERLLNLEQLSQLPPVRPLVDGLLYRNTTAQLNGPPGSYKTFIGTGLACSVALGLSWEGHRVPEAGVVVYVAAEGANGLPTRIYAWCEKAGVDPADLEGRLLVLPEPLQLGNRVDVLEACEVATELGAVLLVLDTRARCTLGLAENDATEQGQAIAAADRIQQAAGCTVLGIHHTGRTGDHGRGSNAWDGAVWSDLRLKGEEQHAVIHCEKHKDVPAGCDHHYRLVPHTVSEDLLPRLGGELDHEWEQRRSTLVAVQFGGWTDEVGEHRSSRVVLDIVKTSAGDEGLTRPQIVGLAEEQNLSRASAYVAVKALCASGSLRNVGTDKRARYVLGGLALIPSEET